MVFLNTNVRMVSVLFLAQILIKLEDFNGNCNKKHTINTIFVDFI